MSIQVFGIPVSRGVAIGRAVLVASSRVDVAHYFVDASQVASEVDRLRVARDGVSAELSALQKALPVDAPPELSALLDVHRMLLHDDTLIQAVKGWISERLYNAEWALSAQLEVVARQFDEMDDPYLRERKADLEQVVERLLKTLARVEHPPVGGGELRDESHDPLILVASDISPADMMQFKGGVFRGFVTDVGGRTSHTAIVARSMDIPAVVGAREASRLIRQDDWVIIDGDAGVAVVDPSPMVLEEYRFRQRQSELDRARLDRLRHTPAVTLDGQPVELLANIERPADVKAALAAGAEGVGLFRSEFLFMNRQSHLPGEDEQFEAYRYAVEGMQGLPVTIRTLDVGADKLLEPLGQHEHRHDRQLNPALGLRAVRWSLAEPAMFERQLRAILRASAHGRVRLLVPMIAHLGEALAVHACLSRARAELDAKGHAYGSIEVGAMIEVPAAAVSVGLFLRHFDFISIGTNDLIQYTLAIDRADETVSHLYDAWHPAVLRLVSDVISQARSAAKPVSVCGEMAGDPEFAALLLAMGLRSFSMHPALVPALKQRILRCDVQKHCAHLDDVLAADDPRSMAAYFM